MRRALPVLASLLALAVFATACPPEDELPPGWLECDDGFVRRDDDCIPVDDDDSAPGDDDDATLADDDDTTPPDDDDDATGDDDDATGDDDDATPPVETFVVGLCNSLDKFEDVVEAYVTPEGAPELDELLQGGVVEWYACANLNLPAGTYAFRIVDEFGWEYGAAGIVISAPFEYWFDHSDQL